MQFVPLFFLILWLVSFYYFEARILSYLASTLADKNVKFFTALLLVLGFNGCLAGLKKHTIPHLGVFLAFLLSTTLAFVVIYTGILRHEPKEYRKSAWITLSFFAIHYIILLLIALSILFRIYITV